MKKILSLMLSLALIISTLALPIAVSAEDIEVTGQKVNLTYTATYPKGAESVRPGETFTVKVFANVTDGTIDKFYNAAVSIKYDKDLFEYKSAEKGNSDATVDTSAAGVIAYDYTKGNLEVTNGSVELMTITFEVKDTALGSQSKIVSVNDKDATAFLTRAEGAKIPTSYDFDNNNLTEAELTVNVAANTAEAKIGEEVIVNNKTYYSPNGVTVTRGASSNVKTATVTEVVSEGEPSAQNIDENNGLLINKAGRYKVLVEAKGGVKFERTFTLSLANVAAKLELGIKDFKEDGYKKADVIEMPVEISGLDGATASMVTFEVDGLDSKFSLNVEGATLNEDGKTVVYGDKSGSEGITVSGENKATVATLKLTAKDNVSYGDATITIKNAKLALSKQEIDPTADKITISVPTKTFTIIPDDTSFVTVTKQKSAWDKDCTGNGYSQEVSTNVTNTEIKYFAVTDGTTPTLNNQTALSAAFASASSLSGGKMQIDKKGDYYIITKVGSVYIMTNTLKNGTDVFYNNTEPSINVESVNMTEWAKSKAISQSDITVTDISGVDKYEISINNDDTYEPIPSEGYSFTATKNGEVTIKVTDKVGLSSTAKATIKVDMTKPTVTIEAGEQANKKVTLNITKNDAESGIDESKTTVTYSGEENGEYTQTVSPVDGVYYADTSGWYKVSVTDKVGNTHEAKVNVNIDEIGGTSDIKVSVVKGKEGVTNGFLTDAAMEAKSIQDKSGTVIKSNGKFTYVKIDVEAPKNPDKYENKISLKKIEESGETDVQVEGTSIELDQNSIGDYKFIVTTKNKNVADDSVTSEYLFSIVTPADMPSVNADSKFNIVDHAYVQILLEGASTDTPVYPTVDNGFVGGYFSGDLNGDFKYTSDDLTPLINAFRAGEKKGAYYSLPIFNMTRSLGE